MIYNPGQVTYSPNEKSMPLWAKDFGGREHIIPFPAKLRLSDFTSDAAQKVVPTGAGTAGVNEQQTITLANATGGTFTITYGGVTSGAIAYNATSAVVLAALEAMSSILPGNVLVSGSAGGPYTITFINDLGYQNITQVTASGTNLTGSSPTVTPATSVAGSAGTTSLTVPALAVAIPAGTLLLFNNGATATVTANVAAAATSIPIKNLSAATPVGVYAMVPGTFSGNVKVLSGRLAGRTYAEQAAGTAFGKASVGVDDEIFLVMFTVAGKTGDVVDVEFYRHDSLVAINYLPGYADLSAAELAWLRANYNCITAFGG